MKRERLGPEVGLHSAVVYQIRRIRQRMPRQACAKSDCADCDPDKVRIRSQSSGRVHEGAWSRQRELLMYFADRTSQRPPHFNVVLRLTPTWRSGTRNRPIAVALHVGCDDCKRGCGNLRQYHYRSTLNVGKICRCVLLLLSKMGAVCSRLSRAYPQLPVG